MSVQSRKEGLIWLNVEVIGKAVILVDFLCPWVLPGTRYADNLYIHRPILQAQGTGTADVFSSDGSAQVSFSQTIRRSMVQALPVAPLKCCWG